MRDREEWLGRTVGVTVDRPLGSRPRPRRPELRLPLGALARLPHGGVGRTGTALAAISVLAGVPPAEAVAWIRRHYIRRAVETPWQRRWVVNRAK